MIIILLSLHQRYRNLAWCPLEMHILYRRDTQAGSKVQPSWAMEFTLLTSLVNSLISITSKITGNLESILRPPAVRWTWWRISVVIALSKSRSNSLWSACFTPSVYRKWSTWERYSRTNFTSSLSSGKRRQTLAKHRANFSVSRQSCSWVGDVIATCVKLWL